MTYRRVGKRALDLVGAVLLLAAAAPLYLAVAAAVWLTMGRPVHFVQPRPGLGGRPFRLVKFRSMRAGAGDDAARLTAAGRWLRRHSLDELPTLLNVVGGQMSLVGPRPLLVAYLPRYSPAQARRHEVRPGVTGLAQVRGRNAVPWPRRLALDTRYVDSYSLRLDLRILCATLGALRRGRGVSAPGHATMPEFAGAGVTAAGGDPGAPARVP